MTELGKEYATALFMLACEKGAKKEYLDALAEIRDCFEADGDYIEFLTCPGIELKERLEAINKAFGDKVPEDVLSYLLLLCEKGRFSCFLQSVEEYRTLYDVSESYVNASVTSAAELSDEEKQRIEAALERKCNRKILASYSVDEALIGGLTVEMDGVIFDGSLKHRLREVKDVINS